MDTARYVEKTVTLFGRLLASMRIDSEDEELGLTDSQRQGLSYLHHHGESSVGEMAEGLGITHPAAVRLVDRLQKKDLVRRSESRTDRRVSLVTMTPAGRTQVAGALSKRTEVLARAIGNMEPGQLADVMRGIEVLLAAVLEDRRDLDSVCLRCGDDHFGCCIVNRTHLELTGTTIEKT